MEMIVQFDLQGIILNARFDMGKALHKINNMQTGIVNLRSFLWNLIFFSENNLNKLFINIVNSLLFLLIVLFFLAGRPFKRSDNESLYYNLTRVFVLDLFAAHE